MLHHVSYLYLNLGKHENVTQTKTLTSGFSMHQQSFASSSKPYPDYSVSQSSLQSDKQQQQSQMPAYLQKMLGTNKSTKKFTQESAITDSFYSSQYMQPAEPKKSVRTSTYIIPDQGNVPLVPLTSTQTSKHMQSYQQIIPKKSSIYQYKPYESKDDLYTTTSSSYKNEWSADFNRLKKENQKSLTELPQQEFLLSKTSKFVSSSQKKFDKFGNELPSWAKPEQEEQPEDNTVSASFNVSKTFRGPSKIEDYLPEENYRVGAPQFVRKLAPVIKRAERQSARFEFEVSGSPEPQVSWFKDGMHVRNTPDTRLTSNLGVHTLIIPEVFKEDSGLYKALVTSPFGTLESFSQLIVEGLYFISFFFFILLYFFCSLCSYLLKLPIPVLFFKYCF